MSSRKHTGLSSRSAALDLLLKTFTNPADIFTQNSLKHQFETISRIVPGTTPQQCTRRWEELRSVVCKCDSRISSVTLLEATVEGKPPAQATGQLNSHAKSKSHQRLIPSNEAQSSSTHNDEIASERPSSRLSGRMKANREQEGGSVAVTPECSEAELGKTMCPSDANTSVSNSAQTIIIIHVFDEAKNMKRDFACPRDILVREMKYFAQYLLPGNKGVEDMDISVHCDLAVFDWLMRYIKKGTREGPMGETLSHPQEAPKLEITHAASILISSDFLQMETLVEECLNFFHKNVSQIVSLNASNISSSLMARLAAKFTPTEVEQIIDKRDRFKRKLYAYLLQQFFDKDYCRVDCPANGSTLSRCTHCCQLLTVDQQRVFPCTSQRMVVCYNGSVGYQHHRDPSWSPAMAVQELQLSGYSLRDIFWWLWGTVNWLVCQRCKKPFKCNNLISCAFHTIPASSPPQPHPCCGKVSSTFSLLPNGQDGCTLREHVVMDSSLHDGEHLRGSPVSAHDATQPQDTTRAVYNTLQAYKDIVCLIESGRTVELPCTPDSQWLQKECAAPLNNLKVSRPGPGPSNSSTSWSPSVLPHSSSQQVGYLGEQPACSYDGGTEEEDGYAPRAGIAPKVTSNKNEQVNPRGNSSHPVVIQQPLDWTWDSSKSRRWNQDLQRECDEQKLDLLISKMQNTCIRTASPKKPSKNKVCFTGGTFCYLETRFRAQQTNKMVSPTVTVNSQRGQAGSNWKK